MGDTEIDGAGLHKSADAEPAAKKPVLRWLGIGAALIAVLVLGRTLGGYVPVFGAWVEGLGWLGPVVFVLGYAIAVVAFIPGSVLTLAAGAIFGLFEGVVLVFIGATLGCTGSFLIARYFVRERAEKMLASDPRFAAIDEAIGREGGRIAFLLRLSPVFPFNLLNYGLGVTKISLRDYVLACVGMLPGTVLYVYSGKVAGDVAAVAGGASVEKGPGDYALLAAGLVATALVTWLVTRTARKALDEATAS